LVVQATVALARAAQSPAVQQPVDGMQPTPAQYFSVGPQVQVCEVPSQVATPLHSAVEQQPVAAMQPMPAQ